MTDVPVTCTLSKVGSERDRMNSTLLSNQFVRFVKQKMDLPCALTAVTRILR